MQQYLNVMRNFTQINYSRLIGMKSLYVGIEHINKTILLTLCVLKIKNLMNVFTWFDKTCKLNHLCT